MDKVETINSTASDASVRAIFAGEATTQLALIDAAVYAFTMAGTAAQPARVASALDALDALGDAARALDLTELERLCGAFEAVLAAARGAAFDGGQLGCLRQAVVLARRLAVQPDGCSRGQAMALIAQLDAMALQLAAAA